VEKTHKKTSRVKNGKIESPEHDKVRERVPEPAPDRRDTERW
jgi:hypothetical protein